MLTTLLLLPFAGAIALALGLVGRSFTKLCAALQLALTVLLWFSYDRSTAGFQYVLSSPQLLPGVDFRLSLGVDGLSLLMLLLTAVVTACAVWCSPPPQKRANLYDACILLISAGLIGAFSSRDLLFSFAFHELALIPTFLMIGIWGYGDRRAAAWKITIYLGIGSVILLTGIADLFLSLPKESRSFDFAALLSTATGHGIPVGNQVRPWCLLLVGFGILVSVFPFHSWAPVGYASSPTPVAMLHAGVLKKFGLYGLLRITVPLLPEAASQPILGHLTGADILQFALLGNILYIGFVTLAQRKLDYMLSYSSVMHAGYILLGIASHTLSGLYGAALLMFAHGLSVSCLFAILGFLRDREGSLAIDRFGGLARIAPMLGVGFALAAFASIGLPGFANFASEMLIFFGSFKSGALPAPRLVTILALWGVVISSVYMLRAYRSVFLGEAAKSTSTLKGIDPSDTLSRLGLALLIGTLLIGGFAPSYFLSYLKPSLEAALR